MKPTFMRVTFIESFKCAFAGIWAALKTERNLKVQLSIGFLAIIAGVILRIDLMSWAILALLIGLVLSAELMNTAIESTVDLVTQEFHPLAKRAKDIGAGAVLIASISAIVVGLLIFGRALFILIS